METPAVINLFLAQECVLENQAARMIGQLSETGDRDAVDVGLAIHKANQGLEKVDLRIVRRRSESSGGVFYVLVNTKDSASVRAATLLNTEEVDLLNRILDHLFSKNNPTNESHDPRFTLRPSEHAACGVGKASGLSKLQDLGWVTVDSGGSLRLSERALAELETLVFSRYGDDDRYLVLRCAACNRIYTSGVHTENDVTRRLYGPGRVFVHRHCLGRLVQ